jgi:hypothetical protein
MQLHRTVLPRFEYTMDGDQAKLDLSRFKHSEENESG